MAYARFWWRNLREKDLLGDPSVDGRKIVKLFFWNWGVWIWTGLSWLRKETVDGHL
jgi:hypothetical protein